MTDRMIVRIPVTLKPVVLVQMANNDPLGVWSKINANIETTQRKAIRLVLTANELDKVFEVISKLAQRRVSIADTPAIKQAIRSARRMVVKLWESGHKYDEAEQGVVQTEDYREKVRSVRTRKIEPTEAKGKAKK